MLPQIASIDVNVSDYKEASGAMVPDCAVEKNSFLEEQISNNEDSSVMDRNCAVEKLSVSLESCEAFCVINTDCSNSLVAQDVSGNDALVSAFNSVVISESSGQRDDKLKDNVTFHDASNTNFFNNVCSSPRSRSIRISRLNQNAQTKKSGKNCRKKANKRALLELIFLKVTRRRRSCFSRRANSSAWESLGNIAQVFEQNTRIDVDQTKTKKSQKNRSGWGSVKHDKTGRHSLKLRGTSCASTRRIRVKIKLGKEVDRSCLMDVIPVIHNDIRKNCGTRIECPTLIEGIEDKLEEELPWTSGFQCSNGSMEKMVRLSDASVSDVCLADNDVIKKSTGNTADNNHRLPSQEEVELVVTADNRCSDPGTSPDSEVINMIPHAQFGGNTPGDLHDGRISCQECVVSGGGTRSSRLQMGTKKGKKIHQADNCSVGGSLLSPEAINIANVCDEHGHREKMGDGSYCSEASLSTTIGNASVNTSKSDRFSRKSLPWSMVTNVGVSCESLKIESGTEVDLCSKLDVESPGSQISETLLPCTNVGGRKLSKNSRSKGSSKSRSEVADSASGRGNARRQKENQHKPVSKGKVKEKDDSSQAVCKVESHSETGNHTSNDLGESKNGKKNSSGDISNLGVVPSGIAEQYVTAQNAWVLCDDCNKWRRIAAKLADSIEETNCRWTCKDNMDKDLADCSIPQEKSNAEINAELEISDCEEDACEARLNSNRLGKKQSTVFQQSSWMLIKSNLFLRRSRKTQTIDEIMVCHCKPSSAGRRGCGDGCLNRMLNIECVQRTCPCGKLCSNQQFQKRKYAKMKWFRCGKKGYGLELLEDISEGQFLIEYVGEVLDMHAYGARQKDYALKGHNHFYFMALNGSEVIDACAKGNMGRFINHSCDPNCRTEKWMVSGEVCIGLFALRDIKKGEEVTFDYNYVRVFGAAAKKCVCGSSQCRGFIGGDPLNTEVIVQGDSDYEYPEPVMIREDGKMDKLDNIISAASPFDGTDLQTAANLSKNKDQLSETATAIGQLDTTEKMQTGENLLKESGEMDNSATAVGLEIITTKEDSMNKSVSASYKSCEMDNSATALGVVDVTTTNEDSMNISASASSEWENSVIDRSEEQLPSSVQPIETLRQPDDEMSETMAAHQEIHVAEKSMKASLYSVPWLETSSLTTMLNKSWVDMNDTKDKSKPDTEEKMHVFQKSCHRMKTSHSSSVKKGKIKTNAVNAYKPSEADKRSHVLPFKSKKLVEGSLDGHFEAVQEKLNELLDSDGGISKRKDASRGYLKLLLLTAASGDSGNGEAIQSNRELSMILDALLKTKSQAVLIDIINKNGLQMLHNIMKQYRREFNKIPILRKLLKILEYLAVREILTLEHIDGGPPHPGVESFRESILTLTEHTDKQVYQIARNFRDTWIPRPLRKNSCAERDDGRTEFNRGSNCNRFSASPHQWCDQGRPTEAIYCMNHSIHSTTAADEDHSALGGSGRVSNRTMNRKRKSRWDQPVESDLDLRSEINEPKILRIETNTTSSGRQNTDEDIPPGFDVPPGFAPPSNHPLVPSNASSSSICYDQENVKGPCEAVIGQPQERFISCSSVSYGIPINIVQQFGISQTETTESWVVAPGVPFHPFPPLPPYPRDNRGSSLCAANPVAMNQSAEQAKPDYPSPAAVHHSDQNTASISGAGAQHNVEIPSANNQHNYQQVWGSSCSMGRKNYLRQQRWNNSRPAPPWVQNRNGWEFMGNSPISGNCVGTTGNEFKGPSCFSEEESTGTKYAGKNTFYKY